jgi:hypothetical protein
MLIILKLAECTLCYCVGGGECLHILPIFLARKFIIDLIIRYVSLNIIGKIIIAKPKNIVFTVSSTIISFSNIFVRILPIPPV